MLRQRSIRWQLTGWYVLSLTIILVIFDVSLVLMVRSHLRSQLEMDLNEEVNELAEEIEFAKTTEEFETRFAHHYAEHGGYSFQVSRLDGTVLFGTPWLRAHLLPKPDSSRELAFRRLEEITLSHAGRHRLLCRTVRGPSQPLLIYVITPLARSERDLWSFMQMLLLGSFLALLVAIYGGYRIARRAMLPVEKMAAAAERISSENLSERILIENRGDELGRLAITLNRTFGRLEKSIAEMRRFTADAAHELRTPLAVIRTEIEVALRADDNIEGMRRVASVTLDELTRLSNLVDQLLTLSRHDAGVQSRNFEEVSLAAVLNDVVDFLRSIADRKQVSIEFSELSESVVYGDDVLLSQLFFNILDNAIKFTPAGGTVQIGSEPDGEFVVVTIEDTGVGIDSRHVPHLFKRFYRVDTSRNNVSGGTGLGLAICQAVVDAHGGELTVESEPGQGTKFTVILPSVASVCVEQR